MTARALDGVLVVDCSRMLPGATLARMLLDLGARLIKVEHPRDGDPLRQAPPLLDGMSRAWHTFLRGAESVTLDLKDHDGAARLRALLQRADVLVESFRPGTLAAWGLDPVALRAQNPKLVICSLPAFASHCRRGTDIGHDVNLVAESGLLTEVRDGGLPRVQLADMTSGVLACSAILAALLQRAHSGAGCMVEQPLAAGVLPFVAWTLADGKGHGPGVLDTLLAGHTPVYRTFVCADGKAIALALLEAKFWRRFLWAVKRPLLAWSGLATGPRGSKANAKLARLLGKRPRSHWLALARQRGLPISPIDDVQTALGAGYFADADLLEQTPLPDGTVLPGAAPFLRSLGTTPARPAPRLGEHTAAVLAEFGGRPVDERG